jgi:hypothetical protein
MGYGAEAAIETLWPTFDRGTWVTPQVAVAASLRDPQFEPEARRRIIGWCSPGLERRDPKALSALIYLCRLRTSDPAWLAELTSEAGIQAALSQDQLRDQGDQKAERWLERLMTIMRQR